MGVNVGQGNESSPDRGFDLYLAALIMVIVAGLFVLGRLAARWSKRQFGWDDYTIVLSLICSIILSITINLAVVHGYGKHKTDLTHQEIGAALKWFYIAQIFYKLVLGLNKTSMLCLYLRIFITRYFKWLCYVCLGVVTTWTLASTFATIFQCYPVAAFWDKSVKARCTDSDAFWYAYGITNIITDAIIFTLPVREITKLHLPRREKIGLLFVFALGAFVCATSIVRVIAVADSTKNKNDTTWSFIPRSVWTLIEANTGIICACLPMLKQPLSVVFPGVFHGSTKNSSGRPSKESKESKDTYQLELQSNPSGWTPSDGAVEPSVMTSITAEQSRKSTHGQDDEESQLRGWQQKHQPQSILRQTEVVVSSHHGESESTPSLKKATSVKEHV